MTDRWTEHLRKAGQKGGQTTGKSKVRGDSAYYQAISKKAAKARKAKRKADQQGVVR